MALEKIPKICKQPKAKFNVLRMKFKLESTATISVSFECEQSIVGLLWYMHFVVVFIEISAFLQKGFRF